MKQLQKHFKNSNELCEYIADWNNGYCFLMFSMGVDSIAAFLHLRKYFKKIVPIYMYCVPELDFIDNSLNYFENVFEKKIIRIPHPKTIKLIKNGFLQLNYNDNKNIMPYYDMDTMIVYVANDIGYPDNTMLGIGNKQSDNLIRRMSISKYGSVNYKRSVFYPIFDWTVTDVLNIIRENNIKIPIDYKLFGRSYDGIMYRFSKPIKKQLPNDYDKLKMYFPLLDIEIKKAELTNGF